MKLVIEPEIISQALSAKNSPEHQLLFGLTKGDYSLLLSAPLLYAYEEELYALRKILGLKFREIEEALSYIAAQAEYVPCHKLWHPTMNKPEKDLTISCAYIGRADHVIVRRPDLYKEARDQFDLNVIDARRFLKPQAKKAA